MFLQSLMKFHQRLFKILRIQNVTDTLSFVRSDGQRENSIPSPQIQGGGGGGGGGWGVGGLSFLKLGAFNISQNFELARQQICEY